MDKCPHCSKRRKTVISKAGRTEFKCLQCDKVDPMRPTRDGKRPLGTAR